MPIDYGFNNLTTTGDIVNAGLKNYSLFKNELGNISGSVTIDVSSGNFVTATVTGNITSMTFSGQSATNASGFVLELTNGGAFSVSWPPAVKWPAGTSPTLTVAGVDVLAFITDDNGTTWRGVLSMGDSK